jgi:hypothetical protein
MNEYGVVQLGEYLVSIPGAVLYLVGIFLGGLLAWGLSSNDSLPHFRMTKFVVLALFFTSSVTLLWTLMGVWFYVKA